MPKVSKKNFIFCLLVLSCALGYSQNSNRIPLECKIEILKPGKQPQPLNFSSKVYAVSNHSFLNSVQTGKKPIFCRMEDDLHKRFNVWIVMRAGSDEEYKKLIDEKDKPKSKEIP